MTIKNYSKQCLMISAGIMVLALLFWNLPTCYSAAEPVRHGHQRRH